jgi:hypothetical protein
MMGRHGWAGAVLLAIGLAALGSRPEIAIAQTDAPATYTGDLWSRPRLTGDWWESRDWLTKRGVTLDLVPFLRQRLDLGLSVEDAVEMYY